MQVCPDYHESAAIAARRFEKEGLQFFSKILPSFYKKLLQVVEGNCTWNDITSFRKKGRSCLPRFLFGLTSIIFSKNGDLKEITSYQGDALRSIASLCLMFYKTEADLPVKKAEELKNEKVKDFYATEASLREAVLRIRKLEKRSAHSRLAMVLDIAKKICCRVLRNVSVDYSRSNIGPGAVAEHVIKNTVHKFQLLDVTATSSFQPIDPLPILVEDGIAPMYGFSMRERDLKRPGMDFSRFCCVPKDANRLRGINIEPNHKIFQQMAVAQAIVDAVGRSRWTRDRIYFQDQSVNASQALKASIDRQLATIDFKDASDRISMELVRVLFEGTSLYRDLAIHRSQNILINQEKLRVLKFGAMGNGFTFPVMSLVFFSLVEAVKREFCPHLPWHTRPYVFGDDVLVDKAVLRPLTRVCNLLGLRINKDKTFVNGPFRESCGTDAFNGWVVTPFRLSALPGGIERKPPRQYTSAEKRKILKLLGAAWSAFEQGFLVSFSLFRYVAGLVPLLHWDACYERVTPFCTPFRSLATEMKVEWDNNIQAYVSSVWQTAPTKVRWNDERLRYLHTLCTGNEEPSKFVSLRQDVRFLLKKTVLYSKKKRAETAYSSPSWDTFLPWSFVDTIIPLL